MLHWQKHRKYWGNMTFNVAKIRADFPALKHTKCFLDSGASAQKPQCVIDAVNAYSDTIYANVHRGTYPMSEKMTLAFEAVRGRVATFLNAQENEIVFTKNVTEAINLVAHSYGSLINDGADIIISAMEHHANIVPWQMLCERRNISLKICPVLDNGDLDYTAFESMLSDKTALVAMIHTSNVLGTVVDVKRICLLAHNVGAKVLIDGSQAIVHQSVDVVDIDADFYCFTAHKLYAPTGVGVLMGKYDLLQSMPPFLGGGDMIESVSFEKTTYAQTPAKFEAGTPPIQQVIGLGCAIDYVSALDMDGVMAHEHSLYALAVRKIRNIEGVRIMGTAPNKAPILSFVVEGIHSFDIAELLSAGGVCVRVGHHCAEPLMQRFGVQGTIRASFAMYNNVDDVEVFYNALNKAVEMLR